MLESKVWFESSAVNNAGGGGSRIVFVKWTRNGHFHEFASHMKFDWDEILMFGHHYTEMGCIEALQLYCERVRLAGCVVEKWLL